MLDIILEILNPEVPYKTCYSFPDIDLGMFTIAEMTFNVIEGHELKHYLAHYISRVT